MKKAGLLLPIAAAITIAAVLILVSRLAGPKPSPVSPSAPPQRIVCMAPNIAETVFALGAGDRVVGVASYTSYPPEAAKKPVVGALYDPDLERIAALEPDLIIVQQQHEQIEELAQRRGIRVLAVDMEGGVQPILDAIRFLGQKLDVADRAESLCTEIEQSLDAVRQSVAGKPVLTTVVCVDRSAESFKTMYYAGKRSFFTDLLEIAGGQNGFADRDVPYFGAGVEDIVRLAPDVIIETRPGQDIGETRQREIEAEWQALSPVPAVKNHRVHVITDSFIAVPGPRIGRVAERLAEVLHPETADER